MGDQNHHILRERSARFMQPVPSRAMPKFCWIRAFFFADPPCRGGPRIQFSRRVVPRP